MTSRAVPHAIRPIFDAGFHSAMQHSFGMLQVGRNFNSPEYKYSFNGQLKDDEIVGNVGSIMSAQFWEYDSRIGRRWNLDPVSEIPVSNYSCLNNNPILNLDILGNKWVNAHDQEVKEKTTERDELKSKLESAQAGLEILKEAGASAKLIKKQEKIISRTETKLSKVQQELNIALDKQAFISNILAYNKKNNPEWYNYWENLVVKKKEVEVVLSAENKIRSPWGETTEATKGYDLEGGGKRIQQQILYYPNLNEKSNAMQNDLIKSRAQDSAHGVGHQWLKWNNFRGDNSEHGEANAREYGYRVIKGYPLEQIQDPFGNIYHQ